MTDETRAGLQGFTDRLVDRLLGTRDGAPPAPPTAEEVMRDPARLAALRRVDLLDSPYDEVIDRLTRIAAKVVEAPVALFTLLDEERQICKSCIGLPESWVAGRESPLAYSFCQRVVAASAPLVIEDARLHPLVRSDPATQRGVIAYAGVPLITSGGHAIGTLCAIDFQPREWTAEEVQTLADLAAALISKIELRVTAREAEERAGAALRAQDALQESETRFRTAFDVAPIGMALQATDGRWIRVNAALCEIVGYSREELLSMSFQQITHPDDLALDLEALEGLLTGEIATTSREKRYIHKDGRQVWVQLNLSLVRDSRGEPLHFITQVQDITERRFEEERLRHLSFRDELTGAFNRRAFVAMVGERLKLARRNGGRLVLLFADLDRMKWINDTFGHLEGDRAINAAAGILREAFRESDVVARLGGDEFAVLADSPPGADPEPLLLRLQSRFTEASDADILRGYRLSVSVGAIVVDPEEGRSVEELIELSDARMYAEKGLREPGSVLQPRQQRPSAF